MRVIIDKAVDELRKKGAAVAAKRSGKDTQEGLVYAYIHPGDQIGVMLEINCETDFVTKNDTFLALSNAVAQALVRAQDLKLAQSVEAGGAVAADADASVDEPVAEDGWEELS